ncbi:MAG TPA: glycosyltransferase [Pyrinomonadaceae bacterium]|nr:glycosyltransferase [Pyrinomonadaceae bacterium]
MDSSQKDQSAHQSGETAGLEENQTRDGHVREIAKLQAELKQAESTVAALTAELTARDVRVNAILGSRAWRYANRISRLKSLLWSPITDRLNALRGGQSNHPRSGGAKISLNDANSEAMPAAPRASAADDVICLSLVDWDSGVQRPQQIMSQFARNGHRVFCVRLDRVLRGDSAPRFLISKLQENVYDVVVAAIRPVRLNQEVVSGPNGEAITKSLADLRRAYEIDNAVAYVASPAWTDVAKQLKKSGVKIIYDCVDEWDGFPGFSNAISAAERRLAAECDLLIVSGERLHDKWRSLNCQPLLARNAVDPDFFRALHTPSNLLPRLAHPIVGYLGVLASWFDVDLMMELAQKRPGYQFVLVGSALDIDLRELRQLENVHVLGHQPYATMPQFLYHFDVCLIPFRLNKTTAAVDPIKVYEYLSCGKPVVSVALPELQPLKDLVYIATSAERFLEHLDIAIAEKDEKLVERRRAFAQQNTWSHRYETIMNGFRQTSPAPLD